MPFSTDKSWPEGLIKLFEACGPQGQILESQYYGPYNKLLNYCFEESFDFFIAPTTPGHDDESTEELTAKYPLHFAVFFIVFDVKHNPVLFAKIRGDDWAKHAIHRFRANEDLCLTYDNFRPIITPLPGISLLGTLACIYYPGTETTEGMEIIPEFQPPPDCKDCALPKYFLQEQWNLNILSQEGFDKMKEIVGEIVSK